jgi:hypothetical protein
MKNLKFLFLFLGLLGTSAFAAGGEFVIIANSGNSQSSISRADLKTLMFGNRTSFAGTTVEPCLWGAKDGEGFFQTVLGVSKVQFNQEWFKKELTGAGRAPKTRDSADDVINCVAGSTGGLGFIPKSSAGKAEGKVRVLELTD